MGEIKSINGRRLDRGVGEEMIFDEKKLLELRATVRPDDRTPTLTFQSAEEADDFFDTVGRLWKITRAVRRWRKALPGRESSERETDLIRLVEDFLKGTR